MKEIKLKEIKPGMVIHYKNDEEKKLLLEELERHGYVWSNSGELPTQNIYLSIGNVIHVYIRDGYKVIAHTMNLSLVTHEFSDLILPETMTEEEYGYDCGLKDAWELAKKMVLNTYDGGIDAKELEKMFGVQDSYTIFKENDVKDVLAKVEVYEKEKEIKAGDVVEREVMGIFVVVNVNTDTDCYTLMNKDGRVTCASKKQISKTGKHIDLSAILAEIGKE